MTRRFFGTDGIRGTANTEPMTPETALKVAMAVGECFHNGTHKHLVVIGKDTRLSGYMLEPALTAGFITMGMDVVLVGPLPTPAIAMLTRSLRADIGVVISASHNPYADNGIKLFGPDGYKLSDDLETKIERALAKGPGRRALPAELGRAKRLEDAGGRYIEFCKSTFPSELDLKGWRIVVDCAHGAGYHVAPPVFHELGADVIAVGAAPDGININAGVGATHPQYLVEQVLANATRGRESFAAISYFDALNDNLKYARLNGSTWQIEALDARLDALVVFALVAFYYALYHHVIPGPPLPRRYQTTKPGFHVDL
jgi:phosphoglucosamine mutase